MAKKKTASRTTPSEAIRQRTAKRDPLICAPVELSRLPGLGACIEDCGTASKLVFSYCAWLFNDEPFGFKCADVGDDEHRKLWRICFSQLDTLAGFVSRIANKYTEAPDVLGNIQDTINQILVAPDGDHDRLARQLAQFRITLRQNIGGLRDDQEELPLTIKRKRRRDSTGTESPAEAHQQKTDGDGASKPEGPPIAEDAKIPAADAKPDDLIHTDIVLANYETSRRTLDRDIASGALKNYELRTGFKRLLCEADVRKQYLSKKRD